MGSTIATFDGLMKERYGDSSTVEKLVYPENVLLSMLDKKGDTGMVGESLKQPIEYKNPQGFGYTFSDAQTNATNLAAAAFDIAAGSYHGVAHIGDKVLKASRTKAGAFLENKRAEIDGLYEQAGENLSIYLWGNGGQSLGQVGTVVTTSLQLKDPASVANFEVDMIVVASANDGSDTAHTLRTGDEAVTGIDREPGTLTAVDWTTISSIGANDYLFRKSDFFGNTGSIVLKGVQAFVTPTAAPPALWGISAATRLTDPQRFAGCRVTAADLEGKGMEERIKILFSRMTGRYKAKRPTAGFMHPEDFVVLDTLMSAKGFRMMKDENTKFGFSKIDVSTPAGSVPIYTDRHCPRGTFFALRMEDWGMHSMKELLHPQNEDGFEMLRRASSTDYEFRLLSYPLLSCRAPKNSGRVPLATAA